ncbi:MAG TPA: hypothetical protein VGM49_03765 [Candidatus Limnocylindrales bacterium]
MPLLPSEIADLNARAVNADAILQAIREYTDLHPSEFGGLYLDQHNGGAVTTLWTGHLADHTAAVWRRIRPGSRVAFRLVTYTYRDLTALQGRIGGDWDWMRAFAIAPTGVGVDEIRNRVELDVSSANPGAIALILAHYAVPAGMLAVTSDGTGAELIPRGAVSGHVLDSLGNEPGDQIANEVYLAWDSDGPGDCGGGDVGYGITGAGRFTLPCQAGGHTIDVQVSGPGDGWTSIGRGHVIALAGTTVELTIRLDKAWASVVAP